MDGEGFLEWNALKQLQLTALALPLMFASLLQKVFLLLLIELLAAELWRVMKMDSEVSAESFLPKFADGGLSLEDYYPLVNSAEASGLGSVRAFSLKKRKK